MHFVVHCLLGA